MVIGIISAGFMGSGLGWALRRGGARVVTTAERRSPRTAHLAAEAGLELLPTLDDVVQASRVVLLVTPPSAARTAAARVARSATRTRSRPLVAELNAIAPAAVESIVDRLAEAGLETVDGAISGPPPTVQPGARIYLSGPAAARIASLPWWGIKPIVLPGPPGLASAVKMCTASVYKGVTAILAQAMRAAAHYGVLDVVLDDLSGGIGDADPGRVVLAARKAGRFVAEMEEIAAAQRAAGLTPALFAAFAEVYADIAATELAAGDPETTERDLPADEITRRLATRQHHIPGD